MGLGECDLKGTFYIIRTTTESWSEAVNPFGESTCLKRRHQLGIKTAYFNSPLLSLGWTLDWNPKGGKKCEGVPIIILGNLKGIMA